MRARPALLLAAALFAAPPAAFADDVKDAIQAALEAYEAGDLAETKFSLDTASQLISEQRAATLSEVLPAAFEGWTAEDGDSAGMGMAAAMFGGGTTISRSYVKTATSDSVGVTIILDSPMVMQFAAIVGNPQMTASMGKSARFGRHRGVETSEGEFQIVVANRALVTIDGSASAEEKRAYAEKIDFDAIAGF
ncbi:hypothetical protein [Neomegalonema sp.]|uniref:hypothetical protein n=1 Tax=Neomegalonema sp. TaxID=2039713 RepID=UPI002639F4D1|nr:hypothetical protein [Neomegalonema sp.]MDD2867043.1 hypothetical protein [Neomegalonema sp.]